MNSRVRLVRYYSIGQVNDINRLIKEVDQLILSHPDLDQICVQTDGSSDWAAGAGRQKSHSSIWDQVHPDLVGTWWETFFSSLPVKVFRTRIMRMKPKSCYSIHKDDTPRLHIAIHPTPESRFLFFKPDEAIHFPCDGKIWWVDTTRYHSAMNGGTDERVHLVMCLNNDED